jgi:hypothetical protein
MAKRARERARDERREAKRRRREEATQTADSEDPPDESALMEAFRVLSEDHAEGLLSDDDYQQERHRIFVELGIETDDS